MDTSKSHADEASKHLHDRKPHSALNPLVCPMLTDMYQITMAYAYWKAGRADQHAVFELFFRKNPFKGQYTVFAGLSEVLSLIANFSFTQSDIRYLEGCLPECDSAFWECLLKVDCACMKVTALPEGTICFPRIPMITVEGPLMIGQLLETPLLNLVNYPSLVATNAVRHRIAAGNKELLEFGLRRAQGPDGGLSASRYSYIGGFNGTSHVLAGKLIGIPVRGTHAHAYIQSYTGFDCIKDTFLDGKDFVKVVHNYRLELGFQRTNDGELAALTAYALAFPNKFLALVDTYDTLMSGVPNCVCVAIALDDFGYRALGLRLDSGDLAFLSKETRRMFKDVAKKLNRDWLVSLRIMASNDINEDVLHSLNEQGHEIDTFAVGTNLVTCQAQPALGCVYKLVEINGQARMKLSASKNKITIPGKKKAYRLFGATGEPIVDLLTLASEPAPKRGEEILCRHPFEVTRRVFVKPTRVQPLLEGMWDGGKMLAEDVSMDDLRSRVIAGMAELREDSKRPVNPTPYKVSMSVPLFEFFQDLWEVTAPIKQLY